MNKLTIISIIIAAAIIGGVIYSSPRNSPSTPDQVSGITTVSHIKVADAVTASNNVSVVNGVQIINLQVKGGYQPRQSVAKAGLPTVLRFSTDNTFDCSRSLRLSGLNLSQILPQTGDTDINIGTPSAGVFRGTCSMGMYYFAIDFQK